MKQAWKKMREAERRVEGMGMGRVVKWHRKARVNYVQCRTGKGRLQAWRHKLDGRKCGRYVETGRHVAPVCTHGEQVGRRWGRFEDMDARGKWAKKVRDDKGEFVEDLVETFFGSLDLG